MTSLIRHDPKLRPSHGGFKPTGETFLTNCKICRAGIYSMENAGWYTDPIGISHHYCMKARNNGASSS